MDGQSTVTVEGLMIAVPLLLAAYYQYKEDTLGSLLWLIWGIIAIGLSVS